MLHKGTVNVQIADLNDDGYQDFLVNPSNSTLFAFTNARNNNDTDWSYIFDYFVYEEAVISNIDRDPGLEIIEVTDSGRVLILSQNGSLLLDKQITTKGIKSVPAIGDIDADGNIEII